MPYSSQIARPPPHPSKKRTAGGDSGEAGPSTKRRDDPGHGPSTAASDQRRSPVQAAPGPSNRAHEPDDLVTAGPEEEPGHSRSEPGHSGSRPGHSFRRAAEGPPDCDSTEAAASSPTMVAERPVSLAVAMGLEVEEGCAVTSRDQLYKNRSSRKIDSRRLFSRENDFQKTFSLTENQFSREDLFFIQFVPGRGSSR